MLILVYLAPETTVEFDFIKFHLHSRVVESYPEE